MITAEEVVQKADATGDVLDVVPETFKRAATLRKRVGQHAPLLPPTHMEGRFAPAEELPGGWYLQANDSGALRPDMTTRWADEVRYPRSRRESNDSFDSTMSASSIGRPRRVESIFGLDDAAAYHYRQAQQAPAGGAFYEQQPDLERRIPHYSNGPFEPLVAKSPYAESVHSAASDSSVSLPFGISDRDRPRSRDGFERIATTSPGIPAGNSSNGLNLNPPQLTYQPSRRTSSNQSASLLSPPIPTYHPGNSANRTGRSPLARKSFTRTATDLEVAAGRPEHIELEVRVPRRASAEVELRGRRGRTSLDEQGRRRLSKPRPGSRSSSKG